MFWPPGVFFLDFSLFFHAFWSWNYFFWSDFDPFWAILDIFIFFFRVRIPAGAFFLPKIAFQGQKHYFFQWFITFLTIFYKFCQFFPFAPPLIRVSSGLVFMKQRPRTKSVRRQHGLGGGNLEDPNKIETPIYIYIYMAISRLLFCHPSTGQIQAHQLIYKLISAYMSLYKLM